MPHPERLLDHPPRIAARPPPRPTMAASDDRTIPKHMVDQPRPVTAPTTQLHTPAPSFDTKEVLAQSVTDILKEIESFDLIFSSTGSRHAEISNVGLETWNLLQMNHAESLNCKLEYLHPENIIIVTYPSGTHESFNVLLKPIADLVNATNPPSPGTAPSFIIGTNHDIKLPSKSSVTPDFGFGKVIRAHLCNIAFCSSAPGPSPPPI
ncbi:hypothetical protein B0H13DRAFT_751837 [Mycena leptocephala]|nr:hypothetical protein B0H13DRAFT_751837 [Mycena leptocephala]